MKSMSNSAFPLPSEEVQTLFNVITEPMLKGKSLVTAIKLDLFTSLQKPTTAEKVVQEKNLHLENTVYFLDVLSYFGWVDKKESQYQVVESLKPFLCRDQAFYLGDYLINEYFWIEPALHHLQHCLQHGPLEGEIAKKEETWAFIAKGLEQEQRCGRVQQLQGLMSSLEEFPAMRKMLDLGCGTGLLSIGLLEIHPHLHSVLMDQKSVLDYAKGCVRKYGMDDRITYLAGDMRTTDLGDDYDFVLASHSISACQGEMASCMKRIYQALKEGGILITLNSTDMIHQKIWVMSTVITDVNFLMKPGELEEIMVQAGFREVSYLGDPSILEILMAKK